MSFEFENKFYQKCTNDRIAKIIAHYELYKKVENIPGSIVEAGVFKGNSLIRFATFREIFGASFSKKIIAFDIFGEFPETQYADDIEARKNFINAAGSQSIEKEELLSVFQEKKINQGIDLVSGDILQTVKKYKLEHPEWRISLLNIDVDIYEPTKEVLEELYELVVRGGVIIFDDYTAFPGANKAIEEFLANKEYILSKFNYVQSPCYIVKK